MMTSHGDDDEDVDVYLRRNMTANLTKEYGWLGQHSKLNSSRFTTVPMISHSPLSCNKTNSQTTRIQHLNPHTLLLHQLLLLWLISDAREIY